MDHMVSIALRDVGGLSDALETECRASEVVSIWSGGELPDGNAEEVFVPRSDGSCWPTSSPRLRASAGAATRTLRMSPAWIDFGAGYNHGGPLRWSPVVVEIFMTGWLARKVAREPAFFTRVPDALSDWVRYAGRVRGVPTEPLSEAVRAVNEFWTEMLEAVNDPDARGPAKTFAVATQALASISRIPPRWARSSSSTTRAFRHRRAPAPAERRKEGRYPRHRARHVAKQARLPNRLRPAWPALQGAPGAPRATRSVTRA